MPSFPPRLRVDRLTPIRFSGVHNFRDIGGSLGAGGRRVRTGLVFRSANLSGVTAEDRATLDQLGFRYIIDFRTTKERLRQPTPLSVESWARDHDTSRGDLVAMLKNGEADASSCRSLMMRSYRTFALEQAPAISELFRRIARQDFPVLFHCTAGKDRTGVAAALLLSHLGVSREDIAADYLLSNEVRARLFDDVRAALAELGIDSLSEATLDPMVGVELPYLDAMFDTLVAEFGSTDAFLEQGLELSESVLEDVRAALLG